MIVKKRKDDREERVDAAKVDDQKRLKTGVLGLWQWIRVMQGYDGRDKGLRVPFLNEYLLHDLDVLDLEH